MTETVLRPGDLAYVETAFSGFLPCKILGQATADGRDAITVKLTADRTGYKRGEILTIDETRIIPRNHVRTRNGHLYVTGIIDPGWSFKFN